MSVGDRTLLYFWLSVIGVLGSIGMAFNLLVIMFIALFTHGKITLDFNKYHEYKFEVVLCSLWFTGGVVGAIWLILN